MRSPIGRDFKRVRPPISPLALLPAGLATLACAFALTSLRTQVMKLRYELGQHVERERELANEHSELTVDIRRMRSPQALAEHARERGYVRPERLIDIESPSVAPAVAADIATSGTATALPELHASDAYAHAGSASARP